MSSPPAAGAGHPIVGRRRVGTRARRIGAVIRAVLTLKLRPDADQEKLAEVLAGLRRLDCPGTLAFSVGTDAGLREGNWSVGLVADFVDAAAYRGYDADPEHNRLRKELAALAEQVTRVQFELPGPAQT
jgi:hypothetical protein